MADLPRVGFGQRFIPMSSTAVDTAAIRFFIDSPWVGKPGADDMLLHDYTITSVIIF